MTFNPAKASDLSARSLRPLTATELAWGAVRLQDALDQITNRLPSVATRLESAASADPAFLRLVVQVQCAVVLRVLNNPDGRLEESADGYSYRLDAAVSTGALYVTDAELGLLSEFDGTSGGAFTIHPARQTPTSAAVFDGPWTSAATQGLW